jgi:hypothetical protein
MRKAAKIFEKMKGKKSTTLSQGKSHRLVRVLEFISTMTVDVGRECETSKKTLHVNFNPRVSIGLTMHF